MDFDFNFRISNSIEVLGKNNWKKVELFTGRVEKSFNFLRLCRSTIITLCHTSTKMESMVHNIQKVEKIYNMYVPYDPTHICGCTPYTWRKSMIKLFLYYTGHDTGTFLEQYRNFFGTIPELIISSIRWVGNWCSIIKYSHIHVSAISQPISAVNRKNYSDGLQIGTRAISKLLRMSASSERVFAGNFDSKINSQ